jgi:hypothetical protein
VRPAPRTRLIGAIALAASLACGARAEAFAVRAFGRAACHEQMTRDAFLAAVDDGFDAEAVVPLPAGDRWSEIADYLGADLFAGAGGDAARFALYSLILGARYPDLRGASATDIQSLREIHRDPDGQDDHFLRDAGDDYAAGDAASVARGEEAIREALDEAARLGALPRDEQIIEVEMFVEFYGAVTTPVWGPAYHFGIAAHAVQDSFSHAVRSDDLTRIYEVANYIDAVTDGYDSSRDGIRHSWAMDRCEEDAAELAAAASPAFAELFALLAALGEDGWPEPGLAQFFERWMAIEPGCGGGVGFCGSKWAALARTDPSLPVSEALFGCGLAPGRPGGGLPWFLALLALALAARRLFPRRGATGGGR